MPPIMRRYRCFISFSNSAILTSYKLSQEDCRESLFISPDICHGGASSLSAMLHPASALMLTFYYSGFFYSKGLVRLPEEFLSMLARNRYDQKSKSLRNEGY